MRDNNTYTTRYTTPMQHALRHNPRQSKHEDVLSPPSSSLLLFPTCRRLTIHLEFWLAVMLVESLRVPPPGGSSNLYLKLGFKKKEKGE